MSSKITIENLKKRFQTRGGGVDALGPIDVEIGDGEFFCIVGPSGCGKSTLLRILADLETYTSGHIGIRHDDAKRALTSMVFQDHALYPWMTVFENAAFGLAMRGESLKMQREKVLPYLETVGLTKFLDFFPRQLSGGMRQRVSLVRAFVMEPEVLLMDEPFAALDAQNKIVLQEELLRIWEGQRKTVVFITHSIEEAILLGDRVAVMSASPGHLKHIYDVPFERPRSVFSVRSDPAFHTMSEEIWSALDLARNSGGARSSGESKQVLQ